MAEVLREPNDELVTPLYVYFKATLSICGMLDIATRAD